jgi:DNA-binding GntR family transcriptional regulator
LALEDLRRGFLRGLYCRGSWSLIVARIKAADAKSNGRTQVAPRRSSGPDVYERMRSDIVANRLEVGVSLVEADLAQRYGTSRTPVREALRRLEQDGLLERGRRGLQVRTPTPEEILEIYEVRTDLEALAAALAAERHTELDMARLKAAAAVMESTPTDNQLAMATANQVFHERLCEAAHNATLADVVARLLTHLMRYPSTTLARPGRWKTVLEDHRRLIQLIGDGDAPGARELARAHMREARDLRLRMYAEDHTEEDRF